jgi:hypothetical protein
MWVFKLPYGLCDELMKMIRSYYWGAAHGKRKTHWLAWDHLMKSKDHGGVGFKDLRLFNQALLARQAWRLIEHPNSLCAQLLKAKYYPNGHILDTVFSGNGSSTWQHAIEHGLALLKKGVIWRVGNGANIRVWRDPWIPRDASRKTISPKLRCRFKWVADFLLADGTWDVQRVQQYFLPTEADEILKIKTSARNENDFIAWYPEKNGLFSVRSGYRMAFNEHLEAQGGLATSSRPGGERPIWRMIWQCPVPPKVQNLAWRICRNALATQVNMHHRGMNTPALCQICGQAIEDTFHIFILCPHARNL